MPYTAAVSSTLIPILLGVLGVLWAIVVSLGAFCFKRIFHRLDELVVHKASCLTTFASKSGNAEDHARFFHRLDDHDRRIVRLEARVEMQSNRKDA